LAKSLKRLTRIPGQTDVRLNSSIRQPASDPRSQTAEPQNNRCDVAASCPHSIFAKRLECCADRSSPPPKATEVLLCGAMTRWAKRRHSPTIVKTRDQLRSRREPSKTRSRADVMGAG